MFPATHGSVGAIIFLLAPNEVGLILGILSHMPMDILGERWPLKKKYRTAAITELLFFLVFIGAALLTGKLVYAIVGFFAGNLMDIIDKPLFFMGKKQLFFCHSSCWPRISLINYVVSLMVQSVFVVGYLITLWLV